MELRQDDLEQKFRVLTYGTHLGFHFTIGAVADKWYTAYVAIPEDNDCLYSDVFELNDYLMVRGCVTYDKSDKIGGERYRVIGWTYNGFYHLCDLPKAIQPQYPFENTYVELCLKFTVCDVLKDIIAVIDRLKKYTLES